MTSTILVLLVGFGTLLAGVGLLGTLLGVRATLESFSNLEIGLIMAAYYAGYIAGSQVAPRIIRNVGHIRAFAVFSALAAAASLGLGLVVTPWTWFAIRVLSGLCVIGLYVVVESWINEQAPAEGRGRLFSVYVTSTLFALGTGQFLLPLASPAELTLFAVAAMLIVLGMVPIAVNRIHEPRIEIGSALGLRQLVRISPVGAVGVFCAGALSGTFWGMAAVFGHRVGLADAQIAMLMAATIFGGAVLQWPVGHLSDLVDRRTVIILISLSTAVVAACAGWLVFRGFAGLLPAQFVYGGLMFSLYGLSVAHANDHLEPHQVLDATRGLLLMFGLGALSGPMMAGAVMDVVGPVGWPAFSTTVASGLALFALYRTTRREPPPLDAQGEFVSMVRTSPVALELVPEVAAEEGEDSPADSG
jgi:MFS family permease